MSSMRLFLFSLLQTQKEGCQRQQGTQAFQVFCNAGPSQACTGCPDPASSCSMPCQSLYGAKGCPAPGQGTLSMWQEAYATMSSALHLQAERALN